MGSRLKDKVAVVTGSGKNIGRAIAIQLAQEGAKVVTNNRSPDNPDGTAAAVAKEINDAGGRAVAVYADVATMDGGKKIIDTALDTFGTIDILVNNAGYIRAVPFWDTTEEQWDELVGVCLKGHFTCTRFATPIMKDKGYGRIVNVSSRVGLHGLPNLAIYAAAKAGVLGFTWSLAQELGQYGITVNCMVPSATTSMSEGARKAGAVVAGFDATSSYRRSPEHVAPIVAFLATNEASKITGQIFYTSGGHISLYPSPAPIRSVYKEGKWTLDELSALFPTAFGTELILAPMPPLPG